MVAVQTNNLARTYYQLEDYETARTLHKQSVAAATAVDAKRWLAIFQSDMAQTLVAQNRQNEAEPLYQAALEVSTELHDLENIVHTQTRLAALYARTGRQDQANTLAAQAVEQARKMHYKRGIADALVVLGDVARGQGNIDTARKQYTEAHRLYTILHDPAAKRLVDYLPQSA